MPSTDPDRQRASLLVVGPGAIGCLVAGRAALAGLPVHLLDYRPERARRLQTLHLSMDGQTHTVRLPASADPATAAQAHHIVICVKAFQTASVAEQLRPHIAPQAYLLSLQNGLGNIADLEAIACRDVRPAVMHAGARRMSEDHVYATGGNLVALAGRPHDPIAQEWKQIFCRAGFAVCMEPDADRMLWRKLVLNAAINPVTALFGIPNGLLPTYPAAASLARDILCESCQIARATGIDLEETDAAMLVRLQALCRHTAENRSSMLCDLEAGRPTEIKQINGAILRHARAHGLEAPVTETLLARFPNEGGASCPQD